MQRVRVGLTGLGAVLLIVAVSAAIFETANNQPSNATSAAENKSDRTVSNMLGNETEVPSEPLAEMGITPGGPASPTPTSDAPK